jgi:hypothetical protein
MNRHLAALLVCCVVASVPRASAADDLDDLLRRLPSGANTIAVVNVKAVREHTGVKNSAVIAGAAYPAAVDMVVYATSLEPGEMENRKTGGLVKLNRAVTLKEIADLRNGEVVNVGTMVVVDFGRRGYSFLMEPTIVGFARRTNLQELFRWKEYGEANKKVKLPPHLVAALKAAKDAPIFGALDLEHLINANAVRERIERTAGGAKMDKEQVEKLANLIASLNYIALTIDGKDLDEATIRMEFANDVGENGESVKRAFLTALGDLGATIDDFETAKATTEGKAVTLTCKVSSDSLVRIMSLFAPPPPQPPPTPAGPKLVNGVNVDLTKKYYQTIDRMLSDLQRQSKNIKNYEKTAHWHEVYADRIESLDTRYVDPDMVKFGNGLLAKLRSLAYSLKGAIVQVDALEKGMAGTVVVAGSSSGWFHGGSSSIQSNTNAMELRTQQAEIVRKDAVRRLEIWEKIDQERRDVLKLVRERYDIDLSR